MQHAPDGERAVHDQAALARTIMRRQARLGLRIAAVFVLILVGLPLLNLYAPGAMATRVGGFSFTWLLLAVLFYPVTWLLSWLFVRGSDRIEAEIVRDLGSGIADRGSLESASAIPDPRSAIPTKRKLFVEDEE